MDDIKNWILDEIQKARSARKEINTTRWELEELYLNGFIRGLKRVYNRLDLDEREDESE